MSDIEADVQAIRALIDRQFASMTWTAGGGPDLPGFKQDFLDGARLYPSARPVAQRSIDEFCVRMSELARATLSSFHERVVGSKVHVFGNIAVAAVVCENTENERDVNRNVEMMLLVKEAGQWRIAAQAWDRATVDRPIPAELLPGARD